MKEEILQVSLQHFLKHGIREMSVQKLTELLGMSTKTFYKHFNNKEELIGEVLKLHYLQEFQAMEQLTENQKIVPYLLNIWYKGFRAEYIATNIFFQDLSYYYPELEVKIQKEISTNVSGKFLRTLESGIAQGVFKEDIKAKVIMEGMFSLYDAVIRTDRFKSFRVAPIDILFNTVVVFIRGFCTAKGARQLEEHVKTLAPFKVARKETKVADVER